MRFDLSPRALTPSDPNFEPPLPGTKDFSRVKGRSGELLVVQIKSGVGRKSQARDALRTLGLKGPQSASLRSDNPSTWGNIDAVRDLVAVIELRGSVHKGDAVVDPDYERPQYGSDTKPAQLVRNKVGDYFAFESDRRAVLLMWSSQASVTDVLKEASVFYPELTASSSVCSIGIHDSENGDRSLEPPVADLLDIVSKAPESIAFIHIETQTFEFAWLAPYQRFHDRETFRAEVSIYGANSLDLETARQFAYATGSKTFFMEANCQVTLRRQGVLRSYPF